jgi:menaquinone-dependent protoporphyrinogen oxidase
MCKRILITFSTRAGSTAGVVDAIGAELKLRGWDVDIQQVTAKPIVDRYDAVILGSAVRMGSWLPEMVEFIKTNQAVLQSRPVALFTVHMLNIGADETSHKARCAYLNSVRPLVNPVDEVFFAGKIDLDNLSFVDRLMVKMVKSPIGDFRDWGSIHAWSSAIFD